MTTIPTYEEACEAKHEGAPQPKMAAGQYWYNQFGFLWKIVFVDGEDITAQLVYTSRRSEFKLENYDSVIYAAGPHLNESEQ